MPSIHQVPYPRYDVNVPQSVLNHSLLQPEKSGKLVLNLSSSKLLEEAMAQVQVSRQRNKQMQQLPLGRSIDSSSHSLADFRQYCERLNTQMNDSRDSYYNLDSKGLIRESSKIDLQKSHNDKI